MAEAKLDPYYAWLGIPPQEKKHYYNLLGVRLFEENPQVIQTCADRQISHLTGFKNGPHAEIATRVLNEMAQARACLLTPAKKAQYDAKLRQVLGANGGGNAPAAAQPAAPSPGMAKPVATAQPAAPSPFGGPQAAPVAQPVRPQQPAAAAPVDDPFGLNPAGADDPFGLNPAPPAPQPGFGAVPTASIPSAAIPAATIPSASLPSMGTLPSMGGLPSMGELPSPSLPAVSLPTAPLPNAPLEAPPGLNIYGYPIWLVVLAGLLAITAVGGVGTGIYYVWPRQGKIALSIPESARSEISLEIDKKAYRLPPSGPIEYSLVSGKHKIFATRPGFHDLETEFLIEPGKAATLPEPWKPLQAILLNLPESGAELSQVQIKLDGVAIVPAEIRMEGTLLEIPALPGARKLSLVRAGYQPVETILAVGEKTSRTYVPMWTAKLGETVEVLTRADPSSQALEGEWIAENGELRNESQTSAALTLPVRFVGSYNLAVDFTRTLGNNTVAFWIPVGDRRCQLHLSGWAGEASGLEMVDGASAYNNPTSVKPGKLENNHRYRLEVAVRVLGADCQIGVQLDGAEFLRWKGPIAQLSDPENAPDAPLDQLVLANWASRVTYHRIAATPVESGQVDWSDKKSAAGILASLLQKLPPLADSASLAESGPLTKSQIIGSVGQQQEYVMLPPEPALVIGVEYSLTETNDQKKAMTTLNTIGAIFSTGPGKESTSTMAGKFDNEYGVEQQQMSRVVAKPGYALAGFDVLADKQIWAMEAIFAKITEDGLDINDRYFEPMFKGQRTPKLRTILSDGRPVVGLHGFARFEVGSVGLVVASVSTTPTPLVYSPQPLPIDLSSPFDVLAAAEIPRDQVSGNWRKEDGAIISGNSNQEIFCYECELPNEFDLLMEVTRLDGQKGFKLGVRLGDFAPRITIDAAAGSGFEMVPNYYENETSNKERFLTENNKPYQVLFRYRQGHIAAYLGDKLITEFKGDLAALRTDQSHLGGILMGANESTLKVTRLELIQASTAAEQGVAAVETPIVKVAIPAPAEVRAAKDAIQKKYKSAYDGRSGPGDLALAATLISSMQTGDFPPAERYAALQEAIELSAEQGAASLAMLAVRRLDRYFEIDRWKISVETLGTSAKRASNPGALWQTVDEINHLRRLLVGTEQLADINTILADLAQTTTRVGEAAFAKTVQDQRLLIDALKPCLEASLKAEKSSPDDPKSALAIGAWQCLVQQDWNRGLATWSKCSESQLAAAAGKLVANRKDADAKLAFADALWNWTPPKEMAYPVGVIRVAARDWYWEGGPSEEQLVRMQEQFAPGPYPLSSKAANIIPVPLFGLAGSKSVAAQLVRGAIRPATSPDRFVSIDGYGSIVYPQMPANYWVHDLWIRFIEAQGMLEFTYGPAGGRLVFWFDEEANQMKVQLQRVLVNGRYIYRSSVPVPLGQTFKLQLYATPEKHFVHVDGKEVMWIEAAPYDLEPEIDSTSTCVAEIEKYQFRPWTVRDSQRLQIPTPGSSKFDDDGYLLRMYGENMGLDDRPAIQKDLDFVVASTATPMVWIKPGSFTRISNEENAPPVEVELTKEFWIGRYELSQGEWATLVGGNPSRWTGSRYLPVDGIGWEDAMRYCVQLNKNERSRLPPGYEYRLPTEAEWEYACRAGKSGDFSQPIGEFWHAGTSKLRPRRIGASKPNPWGLYDMHGNNEEWTIDAARKLSTKKPKIQDPFYLSRQPSDDYIFRGGAWFKVAAECSSRWRAWENARPAPARGFRLVLGPSLGN